ncbi:unnamed protein product [Rhizoctonia solani]|uniref:Inner centromere protein ARK-binding domain-containing protein n=1 Tax=Rhizoctonia solani TaxID=456999 RepID=A0A8H2WZ34_9AGAM|nr:unnamed protein product [Rhizoctonia solani]CAE6448246.1 unnamed protein product [Rhizoctonia solani]
MSVGFTQWASEIRARMAADPGRADFEDQVKCNGYLFLHEYLDDVLNAPRPDNVIEFTKTPGRNKTASKKARVLHASAQKLKPVAPITFGLGPKDKENDSSVTSPKQLFKPALRSLPNHPEPIPETSGPRDSISRATPARSTVPVFSPAAALPTPSDDPTSPFRDATTTSKEQPTLLQVTAQEIFTTKLAISPSSPAPSEKDLPPAPADEPTKASEPAEQDLSIIQEDDEGQSVAGFEDAREEFTDARSVTTVEGDITEVAQESAPTPVRQRLPSPPASEDIPTSASEPPTPVREPEHEPTEPITSTNVTIADIFDNAPAPAALAAAAPSVEPTKKSLPTATSQPTPPPEPTTTTTTVPVVTSPRPLPIPPSRPNSSLGVQQPLRPPSSFAQPIHPSSAVPGPTQPGGNIPRASSAVPRGPFTGPSLKDFRREPSVSGNAHRELRQSSWRKKPDGTSAVTATTSIGSATTDSDPSRLKRKSSALQMPAHPPPSKSQKLSRGSSPSSASSSEDETEMQVPLKDEDGGSWNTGTSMLDDLRNRLARLEKSTSGKTPAASRVWTPTMSNASLPDTGSEKRLSLSDLSVRPASGSSSAAKGKEKEPEVVALDLGLSTDDPAASTLSNRSTTPVDSPPQARRVLPAPPVFALPEPATKASEAPKPAPTNTADAVRAAKAEAARLFGGTKFTAPPVRTETQTTLATEISSVFDKATQSQSQFTQSTAATQLESQDAEMEDELDADLDLGLDPDVDVDGDGDEDMDAEGEDDDAKTTSSRNSTAQTRSMAKQGPVKSIQQAGAAKKAADEQAGKASRLREMEERRQAAALRKAEEEKSRTLESEKKRKEREELAASKSVKAPIKKAVEDPNKKRKLEVEMKAAGKKPAVPSSLAQSTVAAPTTSSSTKSRIAKPTATAGPGPGPSTLKSAMKSTTNPFQAAPPPSTTKTLKPATSSSSLKAAAAKKAKGSISDAPGQALQQQMQARVQAQLKAAQKEPEIQSENIELPDINSEYSDSDDEDRGKDFPSWTQDQALMDALRSQESFNPDALFGPIQPLKMGDLFKTGHSRFRKRTSSANWAGTDGITVEEEIEYARRMGYINQ